MSVNKYSKPKYNQVLSEVQDELIESGIDLSFLDQFEIISDDYSYAKLLYLLNPEVWATIKDYTDDGDIICKDISYGCQRRYKGKTRSNGKPYTTYLPNSVKHQYGWLFRNRFYDGTLSEWSLYKPYKPDLSKKGKPIKYISQYNTESEPFLPLIPTVIRERIAARHKLSKTDTETLLAADSFWEWLETAPSDIEVVVVEGLKKQLSLLSNGIVSIGISGIWNCVQHHNNHLENYIVDAHENIAQYVTGKVKRNIIILFDRDAKQSTRDKVNSAAQRWVKTLTKLSNSKEKLVYHVELPNTGSKGVDDFIVSGKAGEGLKVVLSILKDKKPVVYNEPHKHQHKSITLPTTKINLESQGFKYLGQINDGKGLTQYLTDTKTNILAIKGEKGLGKTSAIAAATQEHIKNGGQILAITHRVSLASSIADTLGILCNNTEASKGCGYTQLALCVDSLHSQSKAAIDVDVLAKKPLYIFIDEIEQFLQHLAASKTQISKRRGEIMVNLTKLFQAACVNGKIIVSDADLSDISINFLKQCLKGFNPTFNIIEVDDKTAAGREAFVYFGKTSVSDWGSELHKALFKGQRIFISTQSQKAISKLSTINLENYIKSEFPNLKVIRIDSESTKTIGHPALNALISQDSINNLTETYDVIVASPTISTGISFEKLDKFKFDSVFICASGTLDTNSTAQSWSRVRDDCPRHVLINHKIKQWYGGISELTIEKFSKALKQQVCQSLTFAQYDELKKTLEVNSVLLDLYCRLGVNHNWNQINYAKDCLQKLENEGYRVTTINNEEHIDKDSDVDFGYDIKVTKNETYHQEVVAISESPDISEESYKEIKNNNNSPITEETRRSVQKHFYSSSYGLDNVTPEAIKMLDANIGETSKLEYLLLHAEDIEASVLREQSLVNSCRDKDNPESLHITELSSKSIIAKVLILKALGIDSLIREIYFKNCAITERTGEIPKGLDRNGYYFNLKDTVTVYDADTGTEVSINFRKKLIELNDEVKSVFGTKLNTEQAKLGHILNMLLKDIGFKTKSYSVSGKRRYSIVRINEPTTASAVLEYNKFAMSIMDHYKSVDKELVKSKTFEDKELAAYNFMRECECHELGIDYKPMGFIPTHHKNIVQSSLQYLLKILQVSQKAYREIGDKTIGFFYENYQSVRQRYAEQNFNMMVYENCTELPF